MFFVCVCVQGYYASLPMMKQPHGTDQLCSVFAMLTTKASQQPPFFVHSTRPLQCHVCLHLLLTLVCMHRSATFVFTCAWPWYVSTGLITASVLFEHKHRHTSTWYQFNTVVSPEIYKLIYQVSFFLIMSCFPLKSEGRFLVVPPSHSMWVLYLKCFWFVYVFKGIMLTEPAND